MRLPGFFNRKVAPNFPVEAIHLEESLPYTQVKIVEAFNIDLDAKPTPTAKSNGEVEIKEGTRDNSLFTLAVALAKSGAPQEHIETAIRAVNTAHCDKPLAESQVVAKAKSAMNYSGDTPIDVAGVMPPLKHEFAAMQFPICAPLIGPIGTQQIVNVAAPPGVGKTQLGIAWGDCLANGRDWLRWPVPQPKGVLLIDRRNAGCISARAVGTLSTRAQPRTLQNSERH